MRTRGWSNQPKVTWLIRGEVGIQNQIVSFKTLSLPLTEAISIYNSGDIIKSYTQVFWFTFSFACFHLEGSVGLLTSLWFNPRLLGLSQTVQNRLQTNPNLLCPETNPTLFVCKYSCTNSSFPSGSLSILHFTEERDFPESLDSSEGTAVNYFHRGVGQTSWAQSIVY